MLNVVYLSHMFDVIEAKVNDSVGAPLDSDGWCWLRPSCSLGGKVSSIGKSINSGRHQNHLIERMTSKISTCIVECTLGQKVIY